MPRRSTLTPLAALALLAACGGGGGGGGGAPPGPTFSVADAQVTEGDAGQVFMVFTVTLAPAADATVTYATASGTATSGVDFVAQTNTLTFDAATSTQTISVAVNGDTLDEADETLQVMLSGATGGASIGDGSAVGTILDDDPLPLLSIGDATIAEGDAGPRAVTLAVTLAPASGRTVTVGYATGGGSAAAGTDYDSTSGTLTFAAGQTSQNIALNVRGDTVAETDETFLVTLSGPVGAALLDSQGVVTITNDDAGTPPVFGLDTRPSNTTCVAPARPTGNASVATQSPFGTLAFSMPTKLVQPPGDPTRWLVLEKGGRIRTFTTANPASVTTWLDLTSEVNDADEGGLLGIAFHPNYPATREVFVSYTTGSPMFSRISRIVLDSTTAPVNPVEQSLLVLNQPAQNHNGGEIAFGPDGALYIGFGDGGGADDPSNFGQNTRRLLGKMLRINVVGVAWPTPGYAIPIDNPFAANAKCGPSTNAADCPEIYAWGLRNPWRFSFDPATGTLWAGDVGQGTWEEVDRIERGGNYGWRCREGAHDFNTAGCPSGGFVEPVSEYLHGDGNISVTGGFVYRGTAIPALVGRYVFGDFNSGRIWALKSDGQGGYTNEEIVDTNFGISSFGVGLDGEIYFVDFSMGGIYKLVPAGPPVPDTIPSSLAATGCVSSSDPTQPASGLVPYDVNAPFWSDGATKSRFIGLPNNTTINVLSSGDWTLPSGSVIVKNFRLGTQLVETRLLMRHPDGVWAGYTYEWNDAQTAATRVIGGKTRSVAGQTWIYPSESDCMTCHTSAAGFSLGLETAQLNSDLLYPTTGRTANQLATLDQIGFFSASAGLPGLPANLPALPDPADGSQSLDARARAYMQTNCSQCHRPSGPTPSSMDLRYTTALSATMACNAVPQSGDLGLSNARVVFPGSAAQSVLIARISRRDAHGMPPLASDQVDAAGVSLLTNWVNALVNCN